MHWLILKMIIHKCSLPQHGVTACSVSCIKKLLAEVMRYALFEYVP